MATLHLTSIGRAEVMVKVTLETSPTVETTSSLVSVTESRDAQSVTWTDKLIAALV